MTKKTDDTTLVGEAVGSGSFELTDTRTGGDVVKGSGNGNGGAVDCPDCPDCPTVSWC